MLKPAKRPRGLKKVVTKKQREAEQAFAELNKRLDALPKFGDKYGPSKARKVVDTAKQQLAERLAEARATPSLKSTASKTGPTLPERYSGEMKEREERARERRHVVAPIANKMGYGLITDAEHLKTMGRKT